jgi:serine/threonine-protein kinase ULK4
LTKLILNEPFSPLPDVSQQLNDLLEKLLRKDPIERIQWPELIVHPFWNFTVRLLELPPQPHFDSWVQKRIEEKNKLLAKSGDNNIERKDSSDDIKIESLNDTPVSKTALSKSTLGVTSRNTGMKDLSRNLAFMSLNASRNIEKERETSTYEVSKRIFLFTIDVLIL